MKPSTQILEHVPRLLKMAHGALFKAAALLYRIREENLYKERFESFSAYLEDIQLDKGQASRLLTSYKHFVVEGGVDSGQLENIDYNKLYLASSLEGSVKQQLIKAQTLSKEELKAEKREEVHGPCVQHNPITICTTCKVRIL